VIKFYIETNRKRKKFQHVLKISDETGKKIIHLCEIKQNYKQLVDKIKCLLNCAIVQTRVLASGQTALCEKEKSDKRDTYSRN